MSESVFKLFRDDQGTTWRISALSLRAWDEDPARVSLLFARDGEHRVIASAPAEWWDLTRRELHALLANSVQLPQHVGPLTELAE